jgi:hypothetical protein
MSMLMTLSASSLLVVLVALEVVPPAVVRPSPAEGKDGSLTAAGDVKTLRELCTCLAVDLTAILSGFQLSEGCLCSEMPN